MTVSNLYKRGLTLLEVITVIAIVGILAALILPATHYVTQKAQRAKAASNLRQIALAYMSITQFDGSSNHLETPSIHAFATMLAKKADLDAPELWIIPGDPASTHLPLPKSILLGNAAPNPAFTEYPLSITVASRLPANAPLSTTPLAWTRGLQPDGSWHPQDSVYGAKGGFIVFLDGHVQWYDALSDQPLYNSQTHTPTADIGQALPRGAVILNEGPSS